MGTPLILMKIIGKAALHACGVGGLWSILVEELPELANNVWHDWSGSRNAAERRSDLEALALLDDRVDLDVDAILAEIAADRPEPVRAELAAYLTQVPVSVRQTLRRPADPTGRTVPPALEPRAGRDLIPFLAAQKPRFQAGDRPIPGVDWELVELLGIGGFGEVWKAKHAHLDDFEPVALKFCTDPQARERLLKHEAKLCARVMKQGRHPGIVQLRQAYLSADPPCLEYEYIDGGTLAGLIKEWGHREPGPTPGEVTRAFLEIAEIVAFAHRLDPSIIHRDLKPSNILVKGVDGATRFKIADFGIGGIATAGVIRATRLSTHPSLMLTKAVGGSYTPLYASPEQAAGGPPDPRDDVHALGVIWYQMLSGDLFAGRPGGSAWKRRFEKRGVPTSLINLLESCFESAEERPADGQSLCGAIRSMLGPFVDDSAVVGLAADGDHPGEVESKRVPTPLHAGSEAGPIVGREIRQFEFGDRVPGYFTVTSVALSPDGRLALAGRSDKLASVFDVATGREIRRLVGHEAAVHGVEFSGDGWLAITGSGDRTARIWNPETGRQLRKLDAAAGSGFVVFVGGFSPDSRLVLTGTNDDRIHASNMYARIWDVATGNAVRNLSGHSAGVIDMKFSHDGKLILTGALDETVRLWDAATGEELRRLEGHWGGLTSVGFSPDDKLALTGSSDGTARIWEVEGGREIHRLRHGGDVRGVAFSPDGRLALTGSADNLARLWEVSTGRELCKLEGHEAPVNGVAFSPDGRLALTGSDDGTARLWLVLDGPPPAG